jgi:sarcosine oxidase
MNNQFDVIVLGVGSMGAASCYYLASRGYNVLGLEQFDIPHDQGSHAGQSRIIRKAYFEHRDYVPLLERAYHNWHHLESISGEQVYFPTGLLYAGKSTDTLIKGVKESAKQYNIKVDSLSTDESTRRFQQFDIPQHYEVLFEPDAGFLTPERCIMLFAEQAIKAGAAIRTKAKVNSWRKEGSEIIVTTDTEMYSCKKLVITAGAWVGKFISGLSTKLKVTRQVIMWTIPQDWSVFAMDKFPCWMIDDESKPGMYYGFPSLPVGKFGAPIGLKLAYHHPGIVCHADQVNRMFTKEEEEDLIQATKKYLPKGYADTHVLKTCLYTNTPDENFIIDFLPGYEQQVTIAAGFSGHGFKFASAVGEIMADLAMNGSTKLPIRFLSAQRFS